MFKLNIFAIVLFLISSCTSVYNYQVFKTESPELNLKSNLLVYEDTNCTITYDLWSESGNPSFLFYNKTNQNILIDLSDCFFILNGISYDYYQNRSYSYSSSSTVSNSSGTSRTYTNSGSNSSGKTTIQPTYIGNSSINSNSNSSTHSYSTAITNGSTAANTKGYSISFEEQKIITIPSNSGKVISEFQIAPYRYRHCDLHKNPNNRNGIDSIGFSKENSPFVFSNNITYQIDTLSDSKRIIKNNFYVKSILNLKEENFYYTDYQTGCDGKKSMYQSTFFKYFSPGSFYISYPLD